MDYLPTPVVKAIEGAIVSSCLVRDGGVQLTKQDPHSQHLIEKYSQTFFIALTVRPDPITMLQLIEY